jgi:2-alkyl-3-oxoalkanoate reductase
VIEYLCEEMNAPQPSVSVPYGLGYAFGWLMEALHPILPGVAPLLTRSLVHVSRDWYCPSDYAHSKLGYTPRKDWRLAVQEALADRTAQGSQWPRLAQAA